MDTTGPPAHIPIIYEDEHLLLVDKPHNMLSQQDHTGDLDVLNACKQYLKQKDTSKRNIYLGLVHRLDRPAGGLMLLAKTPKAAAGLSRQIRDRLIQKTYYAVVNGNPPMNGVLTHYLLKDRDSNTVKATSGAHKQAKKAILSFALLQQTNDLALVSVHLQTGRPHQIRVQLVEEGYPIWGDYKYGIQSKPDGRALALKAVELIFRHPVEKKEMRFELLPEKTEPWNRFNY